MDLVVYLETLPQEALAKLYTSSWTCQAVLRGLPPLGKLYILRLVYLEKPISDSLLESWPRPEGIAKHRAATARLRRLQILQQCSSRPGEEAAWQLQADFKAHLREALTGASGGGDDAAPVPPAVRAAAPARVTLDAYATRQWEALQLYLVGSDDRGPRPPPHVGKAGALDLNTLLESARLVTAGEGRDISEEGFRFLLMDTFHQLWLLLKQYIEAAAARSGARLARVVSFLLQLGSRGVGSPISVHGFGELQLSIAADLAQLGLLLPFRDEAGGIWLSPTRMSLALSGGQSSDAQKEIDEGFIVVETNYRVVGYTSSPIKLAILRMFVRCDVVLPNAFIGTLTRESVTEAQKTGIDHEQIVRYLTQHADPHVAGNVPVVPAVVADQIRLWQNDMRRVNHHRAYLYDDFESVELFEGTADRARALGTWLWEDVERRRLAALADGHAELREFIRSNK